MKIRTILIITILTFLIVSLSLAQERGPSRPLLKQSPQQTSPPGVGEGIKQGGPKEVSKREVDPKAIERQKRMEDFEKVWRSKAEAEGNVNQRIADLRGQASKQAHRLL